MRAELEMTELEELEKLSATPTMKENVLMDVEPSQTTRVHSSTLQSWSLFPCRVGSLVAEEVAGPSNAECAGAKPKKAKIKPSLLKRPCAVVWHVQHDVVQKLILPTRRVGCRSWHTRCTSELPQELGL